MCTDPDGCGNHGADPDAHVLGRRVVLGGLAGSALALGTGEMAVGAPGVGRRPGGQDRRRAKLELVLLGTRAGPPIDPYRMGISTALVVDGSTYLVDCGRGSVTQYVRAGLRLSALRSIFITHLHADHVADYYNYFLLSGSSPNSRGDAMPDHISVYGPGAAGGLPPTFGGGEAPTVSPARPTPGLVDLTNSCHDAHAYSHNVFLRDTGVRDARDLADVHEIDLPDIGADYENTAPEMEPFVVMEDNKVRVSAILVPHGPVFPSFAYRFDTRHGSVTFSGDTTYTPNIPRLARDTDVLVHEAISLEGVTGLPPAYINHQIESHVEVQKVGTIAAAAQARHLVLSHIGDGARNPLNPRQWARWAQHGYHGRVTVGDDLQRIRIA